MESCLLKNTISSYFENNVDNFKLYRNIFSEKIISIDDALQPLITIAIPTFEREQNLFEAIDSAVNQKNYSCQFEILIVNNSPPNKLIDNIERYLKTLNITNVSYYRNEKNIGMIGNWNRCIELAKGTWISFLHDDDILMSNYIQMMELFIKRKRNIGAITSNFSIEDIRYEQTSKRKKHDLRVLLKKIFRYKLQRLYPIDSSLWNTMVYRAPTCGALFRRCYVLELGGFCETLYPSSDWFFLYKLNLQYRTYRPIAYNSGKYRINCNESLKFDTIRGFISNAFSFAEYTKNKTILNRLIRSLFTNEQHYMKISWCQKMSKDQFLPSLFDDIFLYKERKVRLQIYRVLKKIYFDLKFAIALLIG